MSAVRGLLRDLIDRKLWPVALLLLAAAIAVPVYLGRSSSDDADATLPLPSQQANAGKTSKAAVTLEDPSGEDDRRGGVRNPFKQLHVPKKAATPSTDTASNGTPSSSGGSGGSGGDGSEPPLSGSGSGGSGSGGSGSGGDKGSGGGDNSDTDPLDTYHLTLKFGRTDGEQKTYKDVARLSPLPSADNPFFVYTGVLKDGKTAVFLLSSDATATGDGHCKPSAKSCQTIEVKQGDTEFFDRTVDGEDIQYQLDIVRVFKKGASSAAAAVAANERHSTAGADLLRKAHVNDSSAFKYASSYRWLPDRGVLVRAPKRGAAQTSVTGAAAASSADAIAALPGQPVWHWKLGS
jgi:hypothetical protein